MKHKPTYFAIIPAEVRYCEGLDFGARLLYGEISALTNKEGFCWANNAYFAGLFDVTVFTISRWISNLIKLGFISANTEQEKGNRRKLFLLIRGDADALQNESPIDVNVKASCDTSQDPLAIDVKHNSTSSNSTTSTHEHSEVKIFFLHNHQQKYYEITGRLVTPNDKMRLNHFNLVYGGDVLLAAMEAVGERFAVKSLANVEVMCKEIFRERGTANKQHSTKTITEENNYETATAASAAPTADTRTAGGATGIKKNIGRTRERSLRHSSVEGVATGFSD